MSYNTNSGISKLGAILSQRAQAISNLNPPVLDFGSIQSDYSLKTNTYSKPIPKGAYSICRQLTLGRAGEWLTETHVNMTGTHQHSPCAVGTGHGGGEHDHDIKIPEKMRSIEPGDRVLVAWVQNEAVIVDIITKS